MIAIIPAKANSHRVTSKNWREFIPGMSLVDVTIEKLIRSGVDTEDIFVSCESKYRLDQVAERWGVRRLLRDGRLCDNSVPLTNWIREITAQVPGESDIAWAQVCDPLFDDYALCFAKWRMRPDGIDSLAVCYPQRSYAMIPFGGRMQPIGWSFGEHHTPSQELPEFYTMPFTFSILTRRAIRDTGYHVGRNPIWHICGGRHIDIDTETDFQIAQSLWNRGC